MVPDAAQDCSASDAAHRHHPCPSSEEEGALSFARGSVSSKQSGFQPIDATRLRGSILSMSTPGKGDSGEKYFSKFILTLALIASGGFPARRCNAAVPTRLCMTVRQGERDIYPLARESGCGTMDIGLAWGQTY